MLLVGLRRRRDSKLAQILLLRQCALPGKDAELGGLHIRIVLALAELGGACTIRLPWWGQSGPCRRCQLATFAARSAGFVANLQVNGAGWG